MEKRPRVPIENPLVKMSDLFTVVQTLTVLTILAAEHSRNLWYELDTCLLFSYESGSVLDMIIPRLSPQSYVSPIIGKTKELNIYRNAIASSLATLPEQHSAE